MALISNLLGVNSQNDTKPLTPTTKTSTEKKTNGVALDFFLLALVVTVTVMSVALKGRANEALKAVVGSSGGGGFMALVIKVAKQSYSRFQTVKALKDKFTSQASNKQQETPPVPEDLTYGLEAKQVRAVKFAATRMSEGQALSGQVQFHTEFDSSGKREEYRDVTYVENGFIVHNYSAYGHHHQNAFTHESTGTLFKFENGAWTKREVKIHPDEKGATGERVVPSNTTVEYNIRASEPGPAQEHDLTARVNHAINLTSSFRYE